MWRIVLSIGLLQNACRMVELENEVTCSKFTRYLSWSYALTSATWLYPLLLIFSKWNFCNIWLFMKIKTFYIYSSLTEEASLLVIIVNMGALQCYHSLQGGHQKRLPNADDSWPGWQVCVWRGLWRPFPRYVSWILPGQVVVDHWSVYVFITTENLTNKKNTHISSFRWKAKSS